MREKLKQKVPLEKSFAVILERSKKAPLTLHAVLKIIAGKGKPLILIFLALPFCQPIQIPGLSTPFGLAIMFIALRIAFGQKIWLPKSILKKKIPQNFLRKVITKSAWVFEKIKKITHPRMVWICESRPSHVIHGLLLALLGIFLALPLPIPLTNLIAAWAILLISVGMIEEDGLFVMMGYAIPVACGLIFYFFVFKKMAVIFGASFFGDKF